MTTAPEVELPPLPEPFDNIIGLEGNERDVFSAEQMREYARAAIAKATAP